MSSASFSSSFSSSQASELDDDDDDEDGDDDRDRERGGEADEDISHPFVPRWEVFFFVCLDEQNFPQQEKFYLSQGGGGGGQTRAKGPVRVNGRQTLSQCRHVWRTGRRHVTRLPVIPGPRAYSRRATSA